MIIHPLKAGKKEAGAYLLSQYPLPNADLLYVGDENKDEEAFPVIHAHQGITIKVLQPSQAAQSTEADSFSNPPATHLAG